MIGIDRYDELRQKTDTELLQLLRKELDAGVAATRQALGCIESLMALEGTYRRAKRAHDEVSRLLPLVVELPGEDRRIMERTLQCLQAMLTGMSALRSPGNATEDKISLLARALWKAKDCPEGSAEEDWFHGERVLNSQTACVGR